MFIIVVFAMKDICECMQIDRVSDERIEIILSGRIDFDTVPEIARQIERTLHRTKRGEVVVHLDKVDYIDSAGAALVFSIGRLCETVGLHFVRGNSNDYVASMLQLFDLQRVGMISPPSKVHGNFFSIIGIFLMETLRDFRDLNLFIGRFALSMLWSLRHPRKIRWGEVLYLTQRAGVEALPIVGLLSLLIGLVSAFSSAVQLRQFGANIFIADLVGIGMTREMGPLITAIILTGRSGSAFAAEIGTMKISDEIDALTVMGINPHRYLVLPRLLAVMLVMPFLTLFADLAGILGGMFISISSLNLTPLAFLQQLQQAIGLWDVFSGVLKAFVFGVLVAGVGCYRGLETMGGALAVGKSTTASVVSGIFLIVAADSAFAIIFHYLGL